MRPRDRDVSRFVNDYRQYGSNPEIRSSHLAPFSCRMPRTEQMCLLMLARTRLRQ
jgi:hypothetical protein